MIRQGRTAKTWQSSPRAQASWSPTASCCALHSRASASGCPQSEGTRVPASGALAGALGPASSHHFKPAVGEGLDGEEEGPRETSGVFSHTYQGLPGWAGWGQELDFVPSDVVSGLKVCPRPPAMG